MLTKLEEKRLLAKITECVGSLIVRANYKWTDREIAESSKVPPNRLTEYKNYEKYQRSISANHLAKLLGEGFFTVDDIIKDIDNLTKEEVKHLKDLKYFEDKVLRENIIANNRLGVDQLALQVQVREAVEGGLDPIELCELINELKKSGIDPLEVLKSAKEEG